MTEDQLIAEARAGLEAVTAGARATLEGARRAGAAFAGLKRQNPGRYQVVLAKVFDKTEQQARLYVRVHENWDRIVTEGWDQLSLRVIRGLLAKPAGEGEPIAAKPDKPRAASPGFRGEKLDDRFLLLVPDEWTAEVRRLMAAVREKLGGAKAEGATIAALRAVAEGVSRG